MDITETPRYNEMFCFPRKEYRVEPTAMFDRFHIPAEERFSFTIRPMTEAARSRVMSVHSACKAAVTAWAIRNAINTMHYGADVTELDGLTDTQKRDLMAHHTAFSSKFSELDRRDERWEIMRDSVVSVDNFRTMCDDGKLSEDAHNGEITDHVWHSIPPKVKEFLFDEIQRFSGITVSEIASL